MNEETVAQSLEYWQAVNAKTSDRESVESLGAWNEADKLDETDD